MKNIIKKVISVVVCVVMFLSVPAVPAIDILNGFRLVASAASGNHYMINGKSVAFNSVTDPGAGENEAYIKSLYNYVWGLEYTDDFSSSENILKNLLYEQRELNPDNLRAFVSRTQPGTVLRVESIKNNETSNTGFYSVFIVSFDPNGFTVFERTDEPKETYYTWDYFCKIYPYTTIRFLKWPNSYFKVSDKTEETDYKKPDRVLYYDEMEPITGNDVKWVQTMLSKAGYSVAIDGYYSRNLKNQIEIFQNNFSLPVNGIVDAQTANMLEHQIKKPDNIEINLKNSKDSHLSKGDILTVSWEKVAYADSYCIMLYNTRGELIDKLEPVTGTEASFVINETGTYIVKGYAQNEVYVGSISTMSTRVKVHNTFTVKFLDDDGTLLNKQTVVYGQDAVTPASPKKTGYSFIGWDQEYGNVTSALTVNAKYVKKAYTVKFVDTNGKAIEQPQQVLYGDSAVEPDTSDIAGFIGWNRDFSFIDSSITVKAVTYDSDHILSTAVSNATAKREADSSGYTINFRVNNNTNGRIVGRAVVALKTTSGKFLSLTESSAFALKASDIDNNVINYKDLKVFVPYSKAATRVEVYIVENYNDLVPISTVTNIDEIITDDDYTDWVPEDEAPEVFYDKSEPRTEYRFRKKSFKTSSARTLAGWERYDVKDIGDRARTGDKSGWSGWSSWSSNPIMGNANRIIATHTDTFVTGYNLQYWCTQAKSSPHYRHYWDYSHAAERKSYGVWTQTRQVSLSEWNSWPSVLPSGQSYGTYSGFNKCGTTGKSNNGYIWYNKGTIYGSKTYYRYQDYTPIYQYYYYQWGEWSDWSPEEVTASDNVQVETRQTSKYLVNDPTVCNEGKARVITGAVDSSMAGKQATLYIYKSYDASDYTNEYIGQSVISEDGEYSFSFKLREEPTEDTGDYTVALGIEGTNTVFYLDKIEAPKKQYTVKICDYNGTVLETQTVKQGDSAKLPETNPERPGYTFAGWDYSNASIHEDTNITALYVQNEYTVVFIDWTNEKFEMKTGFKYGDPLIAPDLNLEEKYADSIDGNISSTGVWKGVTEGMTVTENMVISAEYQKKTFEVKFYDYDKNVIKTETVEYGDSAMAPELSSDEEHTFVSWECEEEPNAVPATEPTASIASVSDEISYINSDDSNTDDESTYVLQSSDKLGFVTSDLAVFPKFSYKRTSEKPTVNIENGIYEDAQTVSFSCVTDDSVIYYSINGGDEQIYTAPITIDSTSEVSYYSSALGHNNSDIVKSYYIINTPGNEDNWKYPVHLYNGETLIDTYLVDIGSSIKDIIPEPISTGKTFEGFYSDKAFSTEWNTDTEQINNETTLYAKFETANYNVVFQYEDGTEISKQTVEYLGSAVAPAEVSVDTGKVFIGWDTDSYNCVTENLQVNAIIKDKSEVASLSLDKNNLVMITGMNYTLTPTITPVTYENNTILWTSSDTNIATVDDSGKVTAVSQGEAVITACLPFDNNFSATCTVKVYKNSSEDITLNPNSSLTISDGKLLGVLPSKNAVVDIISEIKSDSIAVYSVTGRQIFADESVETGAYLYLKDNHNQICDVLTVIIVGDVNSDGRLNNKDVAMVARYKAGKETLGNNALLAADVDGDGSITMKDLSIMQKYILGMTTALNK